MGPVRIGLGAAGVGLMLVGLYHLLGTTLPDLVSIAVFLAGGVLAHDLLVGPLVLAVGALLVPRLPTWSRAPVVAGLVVLVSVTLTAVPVLGRFGAKPDDPGLLNRPYGVLWLVFALAVTVVVVVACLLRRRAGRGAPDPSPAP
jgi:hypothetical protein